MFSGLTRTFRIRTAIALAAVYALCVLAPAAALAFMHGPAAVHCLNDQHGIATSHAHDGDMHVHADGTTHRHHANGATHGHSDSGGTSHPADCCGLFCMAALTTEPAVTLGNPEHFSVVGPALDDDVAGRGPDRINRPPIA
jgi:hypothetical protein